MERLVLELDGMGCGGCVANVKRALGEVPGVEAIPLALGVLARWGILLHPAVGAVLMSLSTVIVAINAQLLRWSEPG